MGSTHQGGPLAVAIGVVPLGNSLYALSWQEKDGATVTNIQDYDRGLVHSYATLPGGQFLQMSGTLAVVTASGVVSDDKPQRNRALVLEAMTTLFQQHDASAVERLYTPDYIQHNPNIPQGRDALAGLVANISKDVYYEPGLAEHWDVLQNEASAAPALGGITMFDPSEAARRA